MENDKYSEPVTLVCGFPRPLNETSSTPQRENLIRSSGDYQKPIPI